MTISIELHSNIRKDGRQLIQIKVNQGTKRYRISSQIYVKKSDYNKSAKWGRWIRESNLDSFDLNRELENKIKKIRDNYAKNGSITLIDKSSDFFEFSSNFIERYNNQRSIGTYRLYKSKLTKLNEYVKKDVLLFSEINLSFIDKYKIYLKKLGNSTNTISVDLKKIKAIFNQAIKEDVIDYNLSPFNKIKIEWEKSKKERLTKEEVAKIREIKLDGYLNDARNIFLFCVNTMGIRIGDAMRLKRNNVVNGKLLYQMNKTGDTMSITLTKEANEIIRHYLYDKMSDNPYIFPYIRDRNKEFTEIGSATALVNKGLKRIAYLAGINKKITTHIARHTWTQLAIDAKANPRTIQKALGHESFSTTEGYINDLSFNDVDEVNEAIWG